MIEQILRGVCESPYRWLIVISVTLVLGCACLLPLVDIYSSECQERDRITIELGQAEREATRLKVFERSVETKLATLEAQEKRTIDEESTPALRKRLQKIARQTGCTMRRLHVAEPVARAWHRNDNPLSAVIDKKIAKDTTPYNLERWPVSLSLYGSMTSLRSMLDQMNQDAMLVHTRNLEMHPEGRSRKNVLLDLELWYFALPRKG